MDVMVLGGGVAGLAVAYYARRRGLTPLLLEASAEIGGNARTLEHRGFRFDTGAHRFHDRFPEVTGDVRALLGPTLRRVEAPSRIWCDGRWIDFPLRPMNVLANLGWRTVGAAAVDLARRRLGSSTNGDFESVARRQYGDTIAERFLLNYSRKLWGVSCERLSPEVAGGRLKGLSARALAAETLRGGAGARRHLDGPFLYPTSGIGAISERLAEECGPAAIRVRSRVTRLRHDRGLILAVEIDGRETVPTERATLISTLPLTAALALLDPQPPEYLRAAAQSIRFRHVRLVTLFLSGESVTRNATVYFPEPRFLFTRVAEPRNRSAAMAPVGQTSLSIEIPYFDGDEVSSIDDKALARSCEVQMIDAGILAPDRVFDCVGHRLRFAYPVLELSACQQLESIDQYFWQFRNLAMVGRSAKFAYRHIHDLLQDARTLAATLEPGRLTAQAEADAGQEVIGQSCVAD